MVDSGGVYATSGVLKATRLKLTAMLAKNDSCQIETLRRGR